MFDVNVGLRQGCVLSPLVFSLFINTLVDELKKLSCGVECGGGVIPGLLFADGTSLFASDGPGIKKSLDVLVKWCDKWGVKINVQKSGIMHIRQKKVERAGVQYVIENNAQRYIWNSLLDSTETTTIPPTQMVIHTLATPTHHTET